MVIAFVIIVGMLFTLTADLRIAESDVVISTECLCDKVECRECNWPQDVEPVAISPEMIAEIKALVSERVIEWQWDEFHTIAVAEYADEFTALFNSYQVKRAKNGAMMIRTGDTGSFKFARKG